MDFEEILSRVPKAEEARRRISAWNYNKKKAELPPGGYAVTLVRTKDEYTVPYRTEDEVFEALLSLGYTGSYSDKVVKAATQNGLATIDDKETYEQVVVRRLEAHIEDDFSKYVPLEVSVWRLDVETSYAFYYADSVGNVYRRMKDSGALGAVKGNSDGQFSIGKSIYTYGQLVDTHIASPQARGTMIWKS